MHEKCYIEVIAEGEYEEWVSEYIADITLERHGAKQDAPLSEIENHKTAAVRILTDAGISPDEISDAGRELYEPWTRRKRRGRTARQQLTIRIKEHARLNHALDALESAIEQEPLDLGVCMRQPVFAPKEEDIATAQRQAVLQAKLRAGVLADEAGVRLGKIVQIEELGSVRRASGAYGDHDWGGDTGRFDLAGALGETAGEDTPVLASPKRTIWLRYRCRFTIDKH